MTRRKFLAWADRSGALPVILLLIFYACVGMAFHATGLSWFPTFVVTSILAIFSNAVLVIELKRFREEGESSRELGRKRE